MTFVTGFAGIVSQNIANGAVSKTTVNDNEQDFHIDKDGNVTSNQVKVMQISGTTIYTRFNIGLAYIRILVKTDKNTKILRRFGDEIPFSQISTGDIINIEGKVENGSDSLSIVASKIINYSNQKEIAGFRGSIVGTGTTTGSLILQTTNGNITIQTGTTTQIRKGNRIINTEQVRNGDSVIDTMGTFDHVTKTLDANVIVIYIDKKIFVPRNFEGVLKNIGNENPPVLVFQTAGKDYKVFLNKDTTILNKAKKPTSLKRYIEGDTIRVYGAIREVDEPIIDAEVVRNVSLQ